MFTFLVIAFAFNTLAADLSSSTMQISSTAFENQRPIPTKYTCQGENISPPLTFTNVPKDTKTLALIVEDPNAPKGVFDHWVVWNIPGTSTKLEEGANLPYQGQNHANVMHYYGPCPPPGPAHHYRFKLYALDETLTIPMGARAERWNRL